MSFRELTDEEAGRIEPAGDADTTGVAEPELQPEPAAPDETESPVAKPAVRELTAEEAERIETPRSPADQIVMSAGGGFLRGVANVLGLPADLANSTAQAIGVGDMLGASDDPIGGSKSIQRAFNRLGAGLAPGEPYPSRFLGTMGEMVGGSAVPFGLAGAAARTGARGNVLTKPILEAFRNQPRANATAELGAATGAGVGGGVASEVAPNSEGAQIAGQLLGGFASPLSVASRAIPAAGRGAQKAISPFLPGGAERQAARQLKGVVSDPERAAQALATEPDVVPGAQLTPAQETQDPGLLRLERALVRSNADIEGRFHELGEASNKAVLNEAGRIASDVPVERTREFFENRLQNLSDALDARGAQALERARLRIEELKASGDADGSSTRVIRDELESALSDARAQEHELWSQVDDNGPAPVAALKKAFAKIQGKSRKTDDPGNLPDYVHDLLGPDGKLGDTETVGDVLTLRSRLLQSVREEQAKPIPNRKRIRLLNQLQEAALEDVGAQAGDASESGLKIREALNFSRDLNQRFRRGAVGRVLGHERRGTQPPELSLTRLLSKQGVEGELNLDALKTALADSPERSARVQAAAEDFIKARFVQQATDDQNRIRRVSANRFILNHQKLLRQFPKLRKELNNLESGQRIADETAKRMDLRKRGLFDKRSSRASLFLNAPVNKEVARVLRSRTPVDTMAQLVRQTRRDPTGEAIHGLKGQFIRDMLGRSEIHSFVNQSRVRASGDDMAHFFERHRDVISETGLFSENDVKRINRMIETAQKVERSAARGQDINQLLENSPDALIDLVSRIAGANLGAMGAVGHGSPLVAAGAGSRFVRSLTNRIPVERTRDVLAEAMVNRKLMRTLLMKVDSPKTQEEVERRLNAFLVNLLPADEQTEQQQEQEQP